MSANDVRQSTRVDFLGGSQFRLAGIVEAPAGVPVARLIFSHCFTCGKDLKMIVRLSRLLAERGILVLRFDMTGLGGSHGSFSETNFTTNVADLQSAYEFMAGEYGEPNFLIGHSFGGAVSLSITEELQSVIGTITLAAPSDTFHLADVLANMNPDIERSGVGDVTIGGRTFTISKQMLDDFRAFDLQTRVSEISKPILAFHSPTDRTVAYRHAFRIVPLNPDDVVAGKGQRQRSLITLPGSDHLLTNSDADVPYVADIISAWTNRLLA